MVLDKKHVSRLASTMKDAELVVLLMSPYSNPSTWKNKYKVAALSLTKSGLLEQQGSSFRATRLGAQVVRSLAYRHTY